MTSELNSKFVEEVLKEIKKRVRVSYDEDGYQTSDSKKERFDNAVNSNIAVPFDIVENEINKKMSSTEREDWTTSKNESDELAKDIEASAKKIQQKAKRNGVHEAKKIPASVFDSAAREIEKDSKDKCAITYPSSNSAFFTQD